MITWSSKSQHTPGVLQSFDSIRPIQEHLAHRERIINFVNGSLQGPLNVPGGCHKDCPLDQWLGEAGRQQCKDVSLLDSLCRNCEEFYEAAAQAVLLTEMHETEKAKAALQEGHMFAHASEQFQQNLVRLHNSFMRPKGLTD